MSRDSNDGFNAMRTKRSEVGDLDPLLTLAYSLSPYPVSRPKGVRASIRNSSSFCEGRCLRSRNINNSK